MHGAQWALQFAQLAARSGLDPRQECAPRHAAERQHRAVPVLRVADEHDGAVLPDFRAVPVAEAVAAFAPSVQGDHLRPGTLASRDRVVTRRVAAYGSRMASSRGYGRRGTNRLADMSLPAGERGRHRTTRTSRNPVPAQMQHGNSPKARRKRRDGERKMRRERHDDSWG